MSLAADRPEFAPPPQRGTPRALLLALIAHALLIAALTWGVRWKRDSDSAAIEAELWSPTVQQAAPRAVTPPTPPAPAPVPAPPPPPPAPQPDIALEQEKRRQQQEAQRAREEQQRKEREKQREAEEAQERAEQQKLAEQKKREEQQKQAEQKKREEQQKLAEQKKREEQQRKEEQAKQAAAQAAKDRADNLKRLQGMAGTGDPSSSGTAARASGPSGSYAGRVAAAVRPNVTYPDVDTVRGNPEALFDVRVAPDGTIVGVKLRKSSGVPGWDDAAERALRKTEKLPRDVDGRIFPEMTISLRPKD